MRELRRTRHLRLSFTLDQREGTGLRTQPSLPSRNRQSEVLAADLQVVAHNHHVQDGITIIAAAREPGTTFAVAIDGTDSRIGD